MKIQGFKCFREAEIDFSYFTLLAGKNSTGKSTVIQAILALYQNSASSLAGNYMNIGTVNEVKNWIAGSKRFFWRQHMLIRTGSMCIVSFFMMMGKGKETGWYFQRK